MSIGINKVVSFSLFGDNPKYLVGAVRNVELYRQIYDPSWILQFYVDTDTVPIKTIDHLESLQQVEVVRLSASKEPHTAVFWRFYATEDSEIAIFRDCDSRPSRREYVSVLQWLNSGCYYHIMRDHPQHGVPICAGMWGVRSSNLRNIRSRIQSYYDEGKTNTSLFGIDQDFLADKVWPEARHNCYVNDGFFEKKPFSMPRDPIHFVVQAYDDKEAPIHV